MGCFLCNAQNPIIQTKYTADPAPLVYHDTMFLFTGHDEDDAFGFKMKDWLLYTSTDMVNWTDWMGDNLIQPSEPYDELYAHKSFVVKYKGVVYHFYCAVNKKDQRGIAVATSKDLGKSSINFINSKN